MIDVTVPNVVLPPVPGHPHGLVLRTEFIDDPYYVYLDSDGVTQLMEEDFEFEEHRCRRDWQLRGYTARFFYVEAFNGIVDVVTLDGAERADVAAVLDYGLKRMLSAWLAAQPGTGGLQ